MCKNQFELELFQTDDDYTNIVGRIDLFTSKEDFLAKGLAEYRNTMDDCELTVDDVNEGYIRYLENGYDGISESGYYLVDDCLKDSIKVYYIDL